ncbi:cell surface protein [Microbulbifer agarilyticus]|uniref:Cell surface protein n=1 Tax=Microbulbifer agarilyticus TaxID=260552 RepID=A0A1Q2M8Z1_9GAMM|nr:alkaline phosphatase PhoX [Microbulbifer agarilyticus]AQQ69151.1 cell surface protein [Microbulbifer agarilyticus]
MQLGESLFKKNMLAIAVLGALLVGGCADDGSNGLTGTDGVDGVDGADGIDGVDGNDGVDGTDGKDLTAVPALTRVATLPLGSEVTGVFKTDNGEVFFNVQHPSDTLPNGWNDAAVGAWTGVDIDNLDPRLESLPVPASDSAEAQIVQVATGDYQVLGRSGDTFAGALPFGFGAIVNGAETMSLKQSQNPDFNAFIPTNADGSEGMLYVAWEDRPGAMNRVSLQRQDDGSWNVTGAAHVDFSAVKGTLINCFGSVSPWGTPLTSEENYEAENAVNWNNPNYSTGYPNNADIDLITDYLGGEYPNPYRYGYIVEITEPTSEAPVPVKLFTLGRMAHENPVVMPDRKTVYLTDDGSSKGFFKFVADTVGDLGAGTLYAAKVVQDATADPAKAGFDISWIELGHASNAELESWIAEYDGIDRTDYVEGETSYISDAEIADYAAGTAADSRAAFLETLRTAEAMGATVEFNKMEGININLNGAADNSIPYMYVAMSSVDRAMSDGEGDIQVDANKCGVVYRLGLQADFDTIRMEPVVVGGAYDGDAENRCAVDAIANPDNIEVLDDGRVLIGEDTSNHVNNALWVYNPQGE